MPAAAQKNPVVSEVLTQLSQAAPRSIPEAFHRGFFATSAKRRIRNSIIGAICLAAVALLTWLRIIPASLFFLFGAAIGISIMLMLTAAWEAFSLHVLRRPFREFRDGKVVNVLIEEVCLAPTKFHNGLAVAFAFCASCKPVAPVDDSLPESFQCQSSELNLDEKGRYTTTFEVGQIAPALYRPQDRKPTPQLFGFMGLQPDYGIVELLKPNDSPISLFTTIANVAVAILLLGSILSMLLLLDRTTPIEPSNIGWVPVIIGAIVIGGAVFAWIEFGLQRLDDGVEQRNEIATQTNGAIELVHKRRLLGKAIALAGAMLLGGLLVPSMADGLNAGLDFSKPVLHPVQIVSVNEQRETVTFTFPPAANRGNEEFVHHVPLNRIQKLKGEGIAEVRDGALGWKWVRAIHPPK